MNLKQASALTSLMEQALPVRRWDDDPEPDVCATVSYLHGGEDVEVKLWSPSDLLAHYRQPIFIDYAGGFYVIDLDTDQEKKVESFKWLSYGEWAGHIDAARRYDAYFTAVTE